MVVTEEVARVWGVANQDSSIPSSHDIGFYLTVVLAHSPWNDRVKFLYSVSNVNTCLLRRRVFNGDMFVLDDVHLQPGTFKLVNFNQYKRGHNMVNMAKGLVSANPYLLLVGTGVKDFSQVNDPLPIDKLLYLLRCMCLFSEAMRLFWPNWSRVIQTYKSRLG